MDMIKITSDKPNDQFSKAQRRMTFELTTKENGKTATSEFRSAILELK